MNKRIILLLSILLSPSIVKAQWMQTSLTNKFVRCFTVSDSSLFVGTIDSGVFKSNDKGIHWTPLGLLNYDILSFGIFEPYYFAGSNTKGVFISMDKRKSWVTANNDITGLCILILDESIFMGTFEGIYLSTNYGFSWKAIEAGNFNAPYNYVYSLTLCDSEIFAGTLNGVFHLVNNGSGWITKDIGLDKSLVLSVVKSNSNLFAATWGQGIFLSS